MWFSTTAITQIALLALQFASISQALPANLPDKDGDGIVTDEYIVVLKNSLTDIKFKKHIAWASSLDPKSRTGDIETYSIGGFKAYHGSFDRETAEKIASDPQVLSIERNGVFNAPKDEPTPLDRRALVSQNPSSLALARISHRQLGFSNYLYDNSGLSTWIYVLSTGVNIGHSEFGGRASYGFNAVPGSLDADGNGSGTGTAGVAAGAIYGVAKNARIISVRVLSDSGSGTTSGVISGLNWAANDIITTGRVGRAVICLPLGGAYSAALNTAVNNINNAGTTAVFVPAGSDNSNGQNTSPASATGATVVGTLGPNDTKASFSNYGPIVDFFAPGVSVTTAWIPGNAVNTVSGATISTGFAAGLGAYLLGLENLPTSQALVARIVSLSTTGLISNLPADTANRIIYNGSGA